MKDRCGWVLRSAALAAAASVVGGCSHGIVITNTTNQDVNLVQKVEGGALTTTIRPGARATFPAGTPLRLDGVLVEHY